MHRSSSIGSLDDVSRHPRIKGVDTLSLDNTDEGLVGREEDTGRESADNEPHLGPGEPQGASSGQPGSSSGQPGASIGHPGASIGHPGPSSGQPGALDEDVSLSNLSLEPNKPFLHPAPHYDIQATRLGDPNLYGDGHGKIQLLRWLVPAVYVNIVLSILTVLTNVVMNVSLPPYSNAVIGAGSDPYSVLLFASFWFQWIFLLLALLYKILVDRAMSLKPSAKWSMTVLIGFLNGVNGVLVVYASKSTRTPPYLQAILSTSIIPFTIFFRFIILRKGVSVRRLVTTGIVIIGLFVSSEPVIFGLDENSSGPDDDELSVTERIFWPIIFTVGFMPVGIMNAFIEKEMKKEEVHSFMFLTWVQFFNFLTILFLFWTDFIPHFGMVETAKGFLDNLHTGFKCHFGLEESCHDVIGRSWIFISGYCSANLCQFLLIRYAEGAVYAVVVMALVTPLGALFWTLFKTDPFRWDPEYTITTSFTLAGLVIMVPAVITYNLFSIWDAKRAARQRAEDRQPLITSRN